MLEHINWDIVFNWKIWQIVKWIFGVIVILTIVALTYQNHVYKQKLNKESQDKQEIINAVNKVLFDTKTTDKNLIEILTDYMDKRGD